MNDESNAATGAALTDPIGADIAAEAAGAFAAKADVSLPHMVALAVAAGMFIAFGSIAYLIVHAGAGPIAGPAQLLSGAAFSIGLILVMITGAELFTGNTMMILPAITGELGAGRMVATWVLVWLGNLVGSLLIVALFVAAGGLDGLEGTVGEAAATLAQSKLAKSSFATLASGVLANMLVCLAVWMAMKAHTLSAKIVAIIGPVTVFVAAGFEHSVANMSLLPFGLAGQGFDGIPWSAVTRNLAFSTIGNIAGGATVPLMLGYGHRVVDKRVSA